MDQEITFYEDDAKGVLVTDRRLVFPTSSYETREVSSVTMPYLAGNNRRAVPLIVLGILLLFFGASLGWFVAGMGFALITIAAVMRFRAMQEKWHIRLAMRGQEVDAITLTKMEEASAMVAAINQAIRSSGRRME